MVVAAEVAVVVSCLIKILIVSPQLHAHVLFTYLLTYLFTYLLLSTDMWSHVRHGQIGALVANVCLVLRLQRNKLR